MKGIIKISIASILLLSCTSNADTSIKETYFDSGKLKDQVEMLGDTVKHGKYTIYHENGNISQVGNYYMGLIHGEVNFYYESGTLKTRCNYIDDRPDGLCSNYYPSGELAGIISFDEGLKKGKGLLYHKSGELKAYIFYGDNEEVIYRRDYSIDGNLLKENGRFFIQKTIINAITFDVGDTLGAVFHTVSPPKCGSYLTVLIRDQENEIVHSEVVTSDDDGIFSIDYVLNYKGTYMISAVFDLECQTLLPDDHITLQAGLITVK